MMELYKFFHPVMSGASFVPSHNVFQEVKNIGLILSWWNLISEAIVVSKNAFSSASRYLGVLELSNETAVHRVKFLENSKTGNQSHRAKKTCLNLEVKIKLVTIIPLITSMTSFKGVYCQLRTRYSWNSVFATIFEHKSVAFRWFAPQREVFRKGFFSKCEWIRKKLLNFLHLLRKFLTENVISVQCWWEISKQIERYLLISPNQYAITAPANLMSCYL